MIDRILALTLTIIIHVLLIIFAIIYHFKAIPAKKIEQVEILEFKTSLASETTKQLNPTQSFGEPSVNSYNTGTKNQPTPSKVDLPEAMYEFDNPEEEFDIPTEEQAALNQIKTDDIVGNTAEEAESNLSQKSIDNQIETIKDKPYDLDDSEMLNDLFSYTNESGDKVSPFKISGEIKQREIINKSIPKYPSNLQKNAEIKIRFTVTPEGYVKDPIIIKKADPLLERLSLNSLKKWRFNPITSEKLQSGTITFMFELK